jgi:D-sedoheptulose 7-phosphate isomerase
MPHLHPEAQSIVQRHFAGSITAKQQVMESCVDQILDAALLITTTLHQKGKLLLCGNGGSAADAQHLAGEFVSVLSQDFPRPGLAAIALTTDTSILTASANDFGFDGIFERQVQALGQPNDLLIGITTSGNSENVVRAMRYAQQHDLRSIALTGGTGGKIAELADVSICIPSASVQHIQESHITVGHVLCYLVERALFPEQ